MKQEWYSKYHVFYMKQEIILVIYKLLKWFPVSYKRRYAVCRVIFTPNFAGILCTAEGTVSHCPIVADSAEESFLRFGGWLKGANIMV